MDLKRDKKSRGVACFLELPHFPQPFRSDADQLQVLLSLVFRLLDDADLHVMAVLQNLTIVKVCQSQIIQICLFILLAGFLV